MLAPDTRVIDRVIPLPTPESRDREHIMTANVGMIDRVIRIVVGILLIAFALRLGFPETGWNWIGWIGVIPILTAIFGYCPAYTVIGLSTCALTRKET
jgi:Protein of unknown function (DUF2892)